MRRYAEAVGDKVTVEGALHAWIDTDLNVQIHDTEQWLAFGQDQRPGQQRRRLGRREDDVSTSTPSSWP
jgi:hypothetical protein